MSEKTSQQKAEELAQLVNEVLKSASDPSKPFEKEIPRNIMENVSRPSETPIAKHGSPTFKTGTFLDEMFLDQNDKVLDGIPSCSNIMILGIPNTGKSLLLSEICLRLTDSGKKVILATSEDAWRTDSARLDLESRYRERAKLLGLDWKKISENLAILDLVSHAELRDFSTFISTFRAIVEKDKAEIFLCDSVTMIEDSRSNIKFRLNEICRYGQNRGLTEIFVSQRATDDPDSFSVAGNLGLIHIVDIVVELDQKKLSSWDSMIKADTGIPQGQIVNFFRILKCRLSKYNGHYFSYEISKDGLVKLKPKP